MTCCYCHEAIINKDYIYLWQIDTKLYGPVHTDHIKVNPRDKKGVLTT